MRHVSARLLAALLLCTAVLAACRGGGSDTEGAAGGGAITVASFGFSESETLAQIYGQALENAGARVSYKLRLGNREVVGPALEKGEVDMVPEYLGNFLGFLDQGQSAGLPVDQATTKLQELAKDKGLAVGKASPAADGDVLAVTKELAASAGLRTIGDLSKLPSVTLAGPSECETRQTCLLGLRSTYGVRATFLSTGQDAGGPVTKKALDDGQAQVARLFSSDVDLASGGKYVVLQDDRSFQQAGNVIPVLRATKATPQLLEVLDKVSAALSTEELIQMNERTDVDKEDPAKVAADFIKNEGL